QSVNDLEAADDLPDNHIFGRQRVILVHDKKLTSIGIRPGIGHSYNAAPIALLIQRRGRINFIFNGTAPDAFSTRTVSFGITSLNHKALDNAVEGQTVIMVTERQKTKVSYCLRRIVRKKFYFNAPLVRFYQRIVFWSVSRCRSFLGNWSGRLTRRAQYESNET